MAIGWPAALIIITIIVFTGGTLMTWMAGRAGIAGEEAKSKYSEQYRMLASNYENLMKETRDSQAAIRSDLAELRKQVDSIERMMRKAG